MPERFVSRAASATISRSRQQRAPPSLVLRARAEAGVPSILGESALRSVLLRAVVRLGRSLLRRRTVLRVFLRCIVRRFDATERNLKVVPLGPYHERGYAVLELKGELAPLRTVRDLEGRDARIARRERGAAVHRPTPGKGDAETGRRLRSVDRGDIAVGLHAQDDRVRDLAVTERRHLGVGTIVIGIALAVVDGVHRSTG